MAITFPRAMPDPLPFRALTFEPKYTQLRSPTRGGLVQVVNIAPDLWEMAYETPPLHENQADEWKAWLYSLRGGARLFKAIHPLKRVARHYRRSGYAGLKVAGSATDFSGLAELTSIGSALDTVLLTKLPQSFVLSAGDLLSFGFTGGQTLHSVIEGGTASGLGALTVVVEPTIPIAALAGVPVQLADPWCKASVIADSISGPWQVGRRSPVRFQAIQQF